MGKREDIRKELNPLYLEYYDALCDELPSDWRPYWGFRSFTEQDNIFALGRTKPGTIVTNAKAGQSAHNYGCATDWTVWAGNTPIWLADNSPRWKEYSDAIFRVDLKWGGHFKKPDKFHNELKIGVDWLVIQKEFKINGLEGAMDLIKDCLGV